MPYHWQPILLRRCKSRIADSLAQGPLIVRLFTIEHFPLPEPRVSAQTFLDGIKALREKKCPGVTKWSVIADVRRSRRRPDIELRRSSSVISMDTVGRDPKHVCQAFVKDSTAPVDVVAVTRPQTIDERNGKNRNGGDERLHGFIRPGTPARRLRVVSELVYESRNAFGAERHPEGVVTFTKTAALRMLGVPFGICITNLIRLLRLSNSFR